jgi:hypothetical protein
VSAAAECGMPKAKGFFRGQIGSHRQTITPWLGRIEIIPTHVATFTNLPQR